MVETVIRTRFGKVLHLADERGGALCRPLRNVVTDDGPADCLKCLNERDYRAGLRWHGMYLPDRSGPSTRRGVQSAGCSCGLWEDSASGALAKQILTRSHRRHVLATYQSRPVVLLDVDGVINVRDHRWPCRVARGTATTRGISWPMRWAPSLIHRLRALHATGLVEIRWCTTWVGDTTQLSTLFGLPVFADAYVEDDPQGHAWSKLAAALAVAESGRPLIWVDDEAISRTVVWDSEDRAVLDAADTLLIEPDHRHGITPNDMDRIDAYAKAHATPTTSTETKDETPR